MTDPAPVDPFDPDFIACPFPTYETLRQECPVARVEQGRIMLDVDSGRIDAGPLRDGTPATAQVAAALAAQLWRQPSRRQSPRS